MVLSLPTHYFETRISELKDSVGIAQKRKDHSKAAIICYELGHIFLQQGEFEKSESKFTKAIYHAEILRDKAFQIKVKSKLSLLELYRGFVQLSIEKCFEILAFNSDEYSFEAYNYLSWIYLHQGEELKAMNYVAKADVVFDEDEIPFEQKCLLHISKGLMNQHREWYKSALQDNNVVYLASRQSKMPYYEVVSLFEAAKVWKENKVYKETLRLIKDAKDTAKTFGFKFFLVKCMLLEVESLRALGKKEEALTLIQEIRDIAQEKKYHLEMLRVLEIEKELRHELHQVGLIPIIDVEITDIKQKINQLSAEKIKELLKVKEKELKFSLQKNRALLQQLEDLGSLKKIFSHDLKEPLRNIGGYTGKLEKETSQKLNKKESEYFEVIKNATVRMDESLSALLNYLSVGSDQLDYSKATMNQIINKAMDSLHLEEDLDKLQIDYSQCDGMEIECDSDNFYLIFKELISNSIKFAKIGIAPEISIIAQEEPEQYVFQYMDNGIGVEPEYSRRIFELFRRLDRSYEGYGVGLSICKKIIQQHGGTIQMLSQEGKGATFEFTINKV